MNNDSHVLHDGVSVPNNQFVNSNVNDNNMNANSNVNNISNNNANETKEPIKINDIISAIKNMPIEETCDKLVGMFEKKMEDVINTVITDAKKGESSSIFNSLNTVLKAVECDGGICKLPNLSLNSGDFNSENCSTKSCKKPECKKSKCKKPECTDGVCSVESKSTDMTELKKHENLQKEYDSIVSTDDIMEENDTIRGNILKLSKAIQANRKKTVKMEIKMMRLVKKLTDNTKILDEMVREEEYDSDYDYDEGEGDEGEDQESDKDD
jgi:hypothetical protein